MRTRRVWPRRWLAMQEYAHLPRLRPLGSAFVHDASAPPLRAILLTLLLLSLGGCSEDLPGDLPGVPSGEEEQELVDALQRLHEAAEQRPSDGETRGRLAMAYDVNGFPDRAIIVYGQAAVLAPEAFNWPYFQALLMVRTHNDYVGALASLDAAIEVDDTYVPAWLSRAGWLRDLNQTEDARVAYDRAAELGAGAPAAVGIAQLYLGEGQFDEAIAILEPLSADTPDPRIDSLLSRAYRALGRAVDARIASARGRAARSGMQWLDPRLAIQAKFIAGFSNRLLHAQNLIQASRPAAALDLAEALVRERPNDIGAINTLAWANAALQRIDTAKAVLRDGIERYPDEPRFHQMMANAYSEEGDTDQVRQHLERVLELDERNARALEDLGWLVARAGETDAGIALLESALANGAPAPKQVLYRLGLLDGAAERWGQAAARFRDAAKIDAAYTMAYVYLGRCLAEMGHFEEAAIALDWADYLGTHEEERAASRSRLAALQAPARERAAPEPESQ